MTTRKIAIAVSLLLALAGCDDDEDNAASQGGGPGSSNPTDVTATPGEGFCAPTGGMQALGSASYTSNSTAKLDLDGNPAAQGSDPSWQAGTSGSVNGQAVNSAQYAFVVMSPTDMRNAGVSLGDWATVTNTATGQTTYARVEDKGPVGGTGEISAAAAAGVGIQSVVVQTKDGPNTVTVGNPNVTVNAYAGTAAIQGDCATITANNS